MLLKVDVECWCVGCRLQRCRHYSLFIRPRYALRMNFNEKKKERMQEHLQKMVVYVKWSQRRWALNIHTENSNISVFVFVKES